jgi:hypothetical protein
MTLVLPSPGTMFMEMASYVGDVMSFYLDNQIQETFVQYARQTENIYNLAYMLGYRPKVTSVATTTLDFYQILPSVIAGSTTVPDFNYSLEIPTNTIINSSTNNNVKFLIQDKIDFSYSSSSDPTEITVYQTSGGSPTYYLLKKSRPSISSVIKTTTSTFTTPIPFNFIDINDSNIVGILDVFDSSNNQWYEVDNLAQDAIYDSINNTNPNNPNYYSSTDTPNLLKIKQVQNRFATRFMNSGSLRVLFGSGNPNDTTEEIVPNPNNVGLGLPFEKSKLTTAYSPTNFIFTNTFGVSPANTTLTLRYLTGGGIESNVPSGDLNSFNSLSATFKNSTISNSSLANQVFNSLEVNNPEAATGGSTGDSVEEIRQNSLSNFQTQLRAVTTDDYNVRALSLPSQYGNLAKIYTAKEKATDLSLGESASSLNMYVLSYNNDGTLRVASSALKQNLITYLSQFRMINDSLKIKDAFIINIEVDFDIIVLPNYNNDEVLLKCIQFIQQYFKIDNWQINQPIILKDLYVGLDNIDGVQTVKNININNKNDITLGYSQYAYDIPSATLNNVIYPSIDPMIFEIKYSDSDIKGRVVSL